MNEQNMTNEENLKKDEKQKVNVDEIKKIVETEKEEAEPNYISLGLCIGMCGGVVAGILLDNLSLGLGLGMCAGVAVAGLVAYKNTKVDDINENTNIVDEEKSVTTEEEQE